MHTSWKVAAVPILVLGITAVTSTLTTAYLKRIPGPESPPLAVASGAVTPVVPRTAIVEVTRPRVRARAIVPSRPAPAPAALVPPAAAAAATAGPAAVTSDAVAASAPAVIIPRRVDAADAPTAGSAQATTAPPAPAPAASECDAGGRTWKIAKPGLIGTAVGAGLGAAGGAIANGGKGAGQGALIGGLAGAALGGGYGAYRTKDECGNVFGGTTSPVTEQRIPVAADGRASAKGAEAPFAAVREQITIYSAR